MRAKHSHNKPARAALCAKTFTCVLLVAMFLDLGGFCYRQTAVVRCFFNELAGKKAGWHRSRES